MKFVRLCKMCLDEVCSKDNIGKHFSDKFTLQHGVKHGDSLTTLLF
jgi:hypothetical protein